MMFFQNLYLETILKNLSVGVLVEDKYRRVEYVNQTFLDIFGIPGKPKDLIGFNCENLAENAAPLFESPLLFKMRIQELLNNNEEVLKETTKLNDGRVLERDFLPIKSKEKVYGLIWQYRKVTQEKQTTDSPQPNFVAI